MNTLFCGRVTFLVLAGLVMLAGWSSAAMAAEPTTQQVHDRLVTRLRALEGKAGAFGPAYEPIYRAMLPWYEAFGTHPDPLDSWMVPPEVYATELADALENGRNYIAENPGGSFPLVFGKTMPDGRTVKMNYLLGLPDGFGQAGRKFPLIVGLHGSGWLGHRVSYSRGAKTGGRTLGVTPINQRGPWPLDFMNAYLDELLRILPVDADRVYLEGHSLGAMAVWDWAMDNPDRFAAISPRAGAGAMFRAARLKHVPAWVIHGSEDDSVLPAYADQMVTALRAVGGTVKYSLLKGAPHNMPADFDQTAVVDWYLQQTRSHEPVPADPLEGLGISASGFSEAKVVAWPEGMYWKSEEMERLERPARTPDSPQPTTAERERFAKADGAVNNAMKALFKKVRDQGEMVDAPVIEQVDPEKHTVTLWLAVPKALAAKQAADESMVKLGQRQGVRFYARGTSKAALDHAKELAQTFRAQGRSVSGEVWVTPMMRRWGGSGLAEYWVEVK